jgi:tetratricopeptide (TPR) repeat protein
MLFDLERRGRKNLIRFIYLWLALLLGGGLVLFGIGTGLPGSGLVDVFTGSGTDATVQVSDAEKRAKRATERNPRDTKAWADLARARFQTAGLGENFDSTQRTFTESGREKLAQAATAWQKYLALEPDRPDVNLARLMSQVYAETGLNQPALAAEALEIVTEADPSAAAFATLAQYAYLANQTRKGDLASEKAVDLSPETQRRSVKRQLASFRRQILERQIRDAVERGAATTQGG